MQRGMPELPYGSLGSHESAVMVPIKDDFSHLSRLDQDSNTRGRPLFPLSERVERSSLSNSKNGQIK